MGRSYFPGSTWWRERRGGREEEDGSYFDSLLENSICGSALKGRGFQPRRERPRTNRGFSR